MNITHHLIEKAREMPDASALIESGGGKERVLRYAELERRTAQAAALLRKSGLKPGDTVLVLQPVSIELYIALLALLRAGLVAMFLDPGAGRKHVADCIAALPPQGFIGSWKAHGLRLVIPVLRHIPIQFSIGLPVPGAISWSNYQHQTPQPFIEPLHADAPALITFTSGSTGQPKGALRTHGFLAAQHVTLQRNLALEAGEMELSTLPIFILANLASGVTSLIADADLRRPGTMKPEPVLRQIVCQCPSRITASPAFLERLLAGAAASSQYSDALRCFKKVFTGGGPVFPDLLERLQRNAPMAEVSAVYGSTEAEPIALCYMKEISSADHFSMQNGGGLLLGKPVKETTVRIIADQWGSSEKTSVHLEALPPGKVGEIIVCGPHVLGGYLDSRDDAETKIRVNGETWHRTGDAGYLDATGRLWFMGRCSARIADERGVLYPLAVENVARRFDWIRRCALVCAGNSNGNRVLAIELKDKPSSADLEELQKALREAGADAWRIVSHIPMDARHNSKIDYPRLRKML